MKKRILEIIKRKCGNFAVVLMLSYALSACGGGSDDAMWNNYDYRYAPPAADGNDSYYSPPQGYAGQGGYDGQGGSYQDNDSSYSSPKSCAPNSPDLCN